MKSLVEMYAELERDIRMAIIDYAAMRDANVKDVLNLDLPDICEIIADRLFKDYTKRGW